MQGVSLGNQKSMCGGDVKVDSLMQKGGAEGRAGQHAAVLYEGWK